MGTRTEVVKKVFRRLKKNQKTGSERQNFVSGLADKLEFSRVTVSKACRHLRELGVVGVCRSGKRKLLKVHSCLVE